MPRVARSLGALLAVAALPAGCGEGPVVPARDHTIGLRLDEYRILPKRVSAPAGRLRLIVRNTGILTHNVVVERVSSDPTATPVVIARTVTVHPGQRSPVVTFTLAPGTYKLACTIGNHDDLGMTGTLIVK
jgi:plastocyanin